MAYHPALIIRWPQSTLTNLLDVIVPQFLVENRTLTVVPTPYAYHACCRHTLAGKFWVYQLQQYFCFQNKSIVVGLHVVRL